MWPIYFKKEKKHLLPFALSFFSPQVVKIHPQKKELHLGVIENLRNHLIVKLLIISFDFLANKKKVGLKISKLRNISWWFFCEDFGLVTTRPRTPHLPPHPQLGHENTLPKALGYNTLLILDHFCPCPCVGLVLTFNCYTHRVYKFQMWTYYVHRVHMHPTSNMINYSFLFYRPCFSTFQSERHHSCVYDFSIHVKIFNTRETRGEGRNRILSSFWAYWVWVRCHMSACFVPQRSKWILFEPIGCESSMPY